MLPYMPRRYGLSNFVGDLTLVGATCGFWLIWVILRELNRAPRRYGLSNIVGDLTLTGLTGGAWVVWWILRELRRR